MADTNTFGGKRILVVEDDYLIVADMVQELQASGAEVIGPIAGLDKAFERLEVLGGIEGAILDINLQGQMVYPLADELMKRGLPFVFATGYDNSSIPERYADIPRFMKPVDVRKVAEALLEG
ncbi:MAG TPA: response regulator [Devosiaceae bacterium]|jgi:two-component SAPR family response regulator|nr:response regulator [Devosiaceae bacterium]